MKSKAILLFIIVFVFGMTITLFIKETAAGKSYKNPVIRYANSAEFHGESVGMLVPKASAAPNMTIPPVKKYNPNMLFVDNFTGDYLQASYWNILQREKNYNNELQMYVKENAYLQNGHLVLKADYEDGQYKSGLVNTLDKIEFQYGTVEVKMKYPAGKSFFPAIWMMPIDDTSYPEIDILEVVGHNPDTLFFVYHYYYDGKQKDYTSIKCSNYSEFHVYKLKWIPDKLQWFLDDKKVHEVSFQVPNEKMYLIINFAIGGLWPGDPDENTVFPSEVLVDYVKIIPYKPNS